MIGIRQRICIAGASAVIRKLCKTFALVMILYFGYVFVISHDYSVDKAVTYLNGHAETHSRNMCLYTLSEPSMPVVSQRSSCLHGAMPTYSHTWDLTR